MTSFIVEHQCPQCGAPAELEETDRLFRCNFCRVGSFLHVTDVFRYILADNAPAETELIYFPYWRFKGMFFSCYPGGMDKRFADFSQQAIVSPLFPVNVGFRSQTQKLRFAATRTEGVFLKPQLSSTNLMDGLNARFRANLPSPILHQAHIGETLSLIFAPFYLKEKLIDAILNEPVSTTMADAVAPMLEQRERPEWPITFVPTLCPQCGWDLHGTTDALALACDNCQTCWWSRKGTLEQLPTAYVPDTDPNVVYMPFWRIEADVSGIPLKSHADLIRVANLPRVVRPECENQPFYFWAPAFKVRPQRYLSFGAHATAAQPRDRHIRGYPKGRVHPLNLPVQEAAESLKLLLTTSARPRKRMEMLLDSIQIVTRRFRLVYLPFREGHHEFLHAGMKLAINKNLLSRGRWM